LDALRKAGCRQVYEEVISGARAERPVLQQALAHLREGDVLMIWKLDRLGRSLRHLIEVVSDLAQRGIGFKSLQENLDTTTSSGKLVFHWCSICLGPWPSSSATSSGSGPTRA